MKKRLVIAFIIVVCLLTSFDISAQKYAEDYIKSGTISAKVGDIDQAMSDFTKAIELDARVPEGFYNRGLIYLKRKEYLLAEADFARARKLRPDRADILLQSGITAKQLGHDKDAVSFIRKAIKVDPKAPEARFNLGLIFFEKDQVFAAKNQFDSILINKPEYVPALYQRALTFMKLEDPNAALRDLNKCCELAPLDPEMVMTRGTVKAGMRLYRIAKADFSKAIEIDPEYADAYMNRALATFNLMDWKNAESDYSEAIEIDDSIAEAWLGRALCRFNLSKNEEACADLQKAKELGHKMAQEYLDQLCK